MIEFMYYIPRSDKKQALINISFRPVVFIYYSKILNLIIHSALMYISL